MTDSTVMETPTNPTPTNPPLANDPAARTETGEIIDHQQLPLLMNLPQSPSPNPLEPQNLTPTFQSQKDILSMQPPLKLQPPSSENLGSAKIRPRDW